MPDAVWILRPAKSDLRGFEAGAAVDPTADGAGIGIDVEVLVESARA